MQKTARLGLNKPDLTDYVNIADLNENMDVLDEAIGGLQEGTTVIPELQTTDKTLAGAINEVKKSLESHQASYMPHQFVGTDNKKYKYGFRTNSAKNGLIFVYEEVVEDA